jgi:hypothetical protein
MKKIIILLIINALSSQMSHAQQAWTKEKGKFYAQIGISSLRYSELMNGSNDPLPLARTITDRTLQGYVEYGLSNRFMVSAQLPLKFASASELKPLGVGSEGSLSGLSNIQTALTANLYRKNGFVLAAKGVVSLPTARFNLKTGLRTGFDATTFSPSLLAGFGHAKFFTSADLGVSLRNNNYSNRTFASAQIGKFWGKRQRFLSILAFEYMKSGDNGTHDDASSIYTGMYLDKQSYFAYHLKLAYPITPKIKIWLATGSGVGAVNQFVGRVPSYTLSFSYQND